MFTLTAPPEPEWLTLIEAAGDVPAVRVLFAPVGDIAREAANSAVARLMASADPDLEEQIKAALGEDGKLAREPAPAAAALLRKVGRASSAAMIREGIREWEGIGGPDGAPIAVTPMTIEWFIGNDTLFGRADALYVLPVALQDAEKNASAGSPDGIGARATPARDTVSSPAPAKAKGGAGTKKPASRSAAISSTSRKAKARG